MKKFSTSMGGYINSLEGVSVGDCFLIWEGRWDSRLVKVSCTKVTAKQCEIGRHKYRIADARALGSDKWHRPSSLMPFSEEELARDRDKHRVNDMRRKLTDVSWKNMDDGLVQQAYAIVFTVNATKG